MALHKFFCNLSPKKEKPARHLSVRRAQVAPGEEMERILRRFDEDGDGKISAEELRNCMRAAGEELTAEEAEAAVELADSDGDGLLGLEDFMRLVGGEGEDERGRSLKEAFRAYVMEGEGCITPRSLRAALGRLGERRTMEDCEAMILSCDSNRRKTSLGRSRAAAMVSPVIRLAACLLLLAALDLSDAVVSELPGGASRFPQPQSPIQATATAAAAVVSRVAFGSCANQSLQQPIWNAIVDFDPQVFIWLGDNIYGDNRRPFRIFGRNATTGPWKNTPRFYPSSEDELRRRYQLAKSQPGYSKLRRSAQVIGTWDDHDYGLNDAGKEFSGKNTSQRLLLDFLDEPEDSPRRKQDGVYASYVFGPVGKQVKVILLDTRYNRDPLFSDGTILGDSQWEWLEKELYGPGTEITIIASSIQVVSNLSANTHPFFYMESWGHFPKERERLYKLISNSKRSGVFFISGDVHFAEITRYDCGCEYPLYDITSSGLTQAVERVVPPPLAFFLRVAAWMTPSTMRVYSPTCQYKSCTYGQPNFGSIEIDWESAPQRIKFEVRSETGDTVNRVDLPLSELQLNQTNRVHAQQKYGHHCILEIEMPWFVRHHLAFAFFGTVAVFAVALIMFLRIISSTSKTFVQKFKID